MKISRREHEAARKIMRHKLETFKSHREIDGTLDALLDNLGIEVEKSILDEEWEYEDGEVYDASGEYVQYSEFRQEIAALPDLARLAKLVRDGGNTSMGAKKFSPDQWRVITDALDKAGIE